MPRQAPAGATDEQTPTRDRLIATAVQLFGERGIEATSMRALTDAAGANIASVNYHFRSKEGLLRAVVDQTLRAVNDERLRRLDELEATPEAPSVAAVVRTFVEPGLTLLGGDGRDGIAVARFIGRVISEPSPWIWQTVADQVHHIRDRYVAALGRALPDRDGDDARFAYSSMVGLLGVWQSGTLGRLNRATAGQGMPGESSADIERLITFIAAGTLGEHHRRAKP